MKLSDVPPPRVRAAIALSIAIHLCALWLLAIVLGDQPDFAAGPTQSNPVLRVSTIVHRRPAPAPRVAVASAPVRAPRRVPDTRQTAAPPARNTPRARRTAVPRTLAAAPAVPTAAPSSAPAAGVSLALRLAVATIAPTLPPRAPTPTPTPIPTPAPTPTAAPTASATATAAAANFGGLFSQNYPPALADPAELAAIRARLSGHSQIRVDVDETGHATGVEFTAPLADETLTAEIRAALLALRYVPADCNGLHCDGTLEIRY